MVAQVHVHMNGNRYLYTCEGQSENIPSDVHPVKIQIWEIRPRGYKTFFVFSSAEHEICPAN